MKSSIIILGLVLSGCQTLIAPGKIEIPSVHRHFFGTCPISEASLRFSASLGSQQLAGAYLDWLFSGNVWQWEASDALGRTLLRASLDGKTWAASGNFARHLQGFSLTKKGQIVYKSRDVLLTFKELMCVLTMRFPEEWSEYAVKLEILKDKETVFFEDEHRFWRVDFLNDDALTLCGSMGTWTLGIFRREYVHWCLREEEKKGTLTFSDLVNLEWQLNEGDRVTWLSY